MGLFGFGQKQDDTADQTQAGGQDQWSEQPAGQDSAQPAPVPSIDGVLPAAHGAPAPPKPIQPVVAQPEPTEVTANDAGDYIMEEPKLQSAPVPEENTDVEPKIESAYGGTSTEPQVVSEPQPSEPVPAPPLPVATTSVADEVVVDDDQPEQTVAAAESDDELSDIKQRALMDLTPLVDRLDQTPEEKFHTIMMLLQNTDRLSLIKTAYEAALKIEDETTKAEALLDVVNEINYFNQKQEEELDKQQSEEDE